MQFYGDKGVDKLLTDMELENLDRAIKDIGQANICVTAPVIVGIKDAST